VVAERLANDRREESHLDKVKKRKKSCKKHPSEEIKGTFDILEGGGLSDAITQVRG